MANYINRYKPPIYDGNDTMEGLYEVQNIEIKKLNDIEKKIINNTFIKSAELSGIQRFENLLEMKNNAYFNLEQRRENVLNKMLFTPPYTRQKMNEILFNIYGRGGYAFEIYPDDFKCIIDIDTTDPIIYLQFSKDVRNVIPANMFLIFAIQYTHLYLQRHFTHREMQKLTYRELTKYNKETKEVKDGPDNTL